MQDSFFNPHFLEKETGSEKLSPSQYFFCYTQTLGVHGAFHLYLLLLDQKLREYIKAA